MPQQANLKEVEIAGRTIRIRWREARFGEWLAWCYVPAESGDHNQGIGLEARATTGDAACEALMKQLHERLAGGD